MKIQHPLVVRAIGSTGAALVWQLGRTLTYHFRYKDPVVDPEVARRPASATSMRSSTRSCSSRPITGTGPRCTS